MYVWRFYLILFILLKYTTHFLSIIKLSIHNRTIVHTIPCTVAERYLIHISDLLCLIITIKCTLLAIRTPIFRDIMLWLHRAKTQCFIFQSSKKLIKMRHTLEELDLQKYVKVYISLLSLVLCGDIFMIWSIVKVF